MESNFIAFKRNFLHSRTKTFTGLATTPAPKSNTQRFAGQIESPVACFTPMCQFRMSLWHLLAYVLLLLMTVAAVSPVRPSKVTKNGLRKGGTKVTKVTKKPKPAGGLLTYKIILARQTQSRSHYIEGPPELVDSTEIWTVGLKPDWDSKAHSFGSCQRTRWDYKRGSWQVFKSIAITSTANVLEFGTVTMSMSTRKSVTTSLNRELRSYTHLPNLFFQNQTVTLLQEKLSSRAQGGDHLRAEPEVTNLSIDRPTWDLYFYGMLLVKGSGAGLAITEDMKDEWDMYNENITEALKDHSGPAWTILSRDLFHPAWNPILESWEPAV
ncbi:hypothetical protein F5880DRAFT_1334631 [Lentinula raphanica]|nr:hypothetical protein F5880DRAFT_1334631 [Lentinula raphanica]